MLAGKRRALARTLSRPAADPRHGHGPDEQSSLMLLDEPTAGLSPKAADDLFDAIVALNRDGLPILMVDSMRWRRWPSPIVATCCFRAQQRREPARALQQTPEIRRLFLGG